MTNDDDTPTPASVATLLREAAEYFEADAELQSEMRDPRAIAEDISAFLANDGCLSKARDGEPGFTLLGRDPDAALLVREWGARRTAACARSGLDQDHARSAEHVAAAIDAYRADPANWPASAPPVEAYPPSPAETYRFARQIADQLLLSNLTVKVLRTMTLSKFELAPGPVVEQAKLWLREYVDGTREAHGPLGSPMMWPNGIPGVEALLRGWGFQPTPTVPAYVAHVPESVN